MGFNQSFKEYVEFAEKRTYHELMILKQQNLLPGIHFCASTALLNASVVPGMLFGAENSK